MKALATRVRSDGLTRPAAAFVLATVLGALVSLLRLPLQPLLGAEAPFVLAWPGIILAASLGGFWPAVLVTLISFAIGQAAVASGGEGGLRPAAAAVFVVFGLAAAVAGEMRQRGLRRARENAARLAQLQSRIVQVSRLNAVGELGGTLAHELNQPLCAIGNYVSAARQHLSRQGRGDALLEELLDKVGNQAVRAGQIVARVRASLGSGEIELRPVSLSRLVQEAVDVAQLGDARGIPVRYEFDRAADQVLADAVQAQQVVLNLVRNAVEAMAGAPRRELRIGSRPAGEGHVEAYVADTGPGIAPDVAERLFQPFVSDKPGGMGVGLSISRQIIEAHGGRLWFSDNPGGGAVFHFTLRRPG